MSNQALSDIQQTIDKLFARLDAAQTGGVITQANHALRVQITKKRQLGAALSAREQEIVAAIGEIAPKKRGGSFSLAVLVLIVIVIAALYVAYRFMGASI